ncbi:quinone oxidoreductase family protein [Streptomyces sp. P6-2-1]|uniref:quinone oxidoreductase family protein n=1 Tax=Streptomyces sp. P6-2-1 TaxID=3422591 RepID=UPI003D35D9B0
MKAVGFDAPGGPGVLRVLDLPVPEPGPGEVRVRVHGATVNPADTLVRAGAAGPRGLPGPHVPGLEVAGVVDATGEGVTRLAAGDPVMALTLPLRPHRGGYAEYVVLPEPHAVRAPAGLTLTEAATLPMNGLTALRAIEVLGLGAGTTAAVTGAAGAFGGYFTELCVLAGIRVVADAAPADEALVRALGADVVARRGAAYVADVLDAAPGGVYGLADGALLGTPVLDAVADGGTYTSLRTPGEPGTRPLPDPAPRGLAYRSLQFYEIADPTAALGRLAEAAGAGRLTPRIAEVITPEDVPRAHEALAAGGVRGRFVLGFG